MPQCSCEEAKSCSAVNVPCVLQNTKLLGRWGKGGAGGSAAPGHQERKQRKNGRKMNILNKKK
jgi:hypothetical protein